MVLLLCHLLASVTVLGPRLLRDDGEVQFLGASDDRQQRSGSQLGLGQQSMQVVDAADGVTVVGDDDISFEETGTLGWTAGFDGGDQNTALQRQMVETCQTAWQRDVLPSHTDIAAPHLAISDEPAGYEGRRIDGHGKTEPLRWQDHGGIDADDFAA